tara:strand:+ start:11309 stop:11989 length:681 start_codon:yes stop_codon:yes gene_type:complete
MDILSIIPARGGSKGIKSKNMKIINGKTLLEYSVDASLRSKWINKTVVSTDDSKILKQAKKVGAEVIKRPKKLSTDSASIESTMEHCLEFLKKEEDYIPEIIILLQNTSPLRNANHIDDAITLFLKNKNDSMLSGYNSHHFIWKSDGKNIAPVNYNPKKRPNRQKFNNQFIENGAIYITKYKSFRTSKCRVSGKIGLYEMPKELSVDIDTENDLDNVRQFMKKKSK